MKSRDGSWLLSARASRLFFASSVIVLAVGCLVVVLAKLLQNTSVTEINSKINNTPVLYVPIAVVLIVNAFSAIFLLVGMFWYWVRFDDSRRFVNVLWLVSFVWLGWYSMSIYYFLIYRRQTWLVQTRRSPSTLLASIGSKRWAIEAPVSIKWIALAGCAVGFIATGVVGFWPAVLRTTRIPLYLVEPGGWCIFVTACYIVFKFVKAGLKR